MAQKSCRAVLMTPAARQSLESDAAALAIELDRYLIETIMEFRARPLLTHADRF